jgi:hypothetical protein
MRELSADRGGIVDFAGNLVMGGEALGEQRLELPFIADIKAVDGLLEAEFVFG